MVEIVVVIVVVAGSDGTREKLHNLVSNLWNPFVFHVSSFCLSVSSVRGCRGEGVDWRSVRCVCVVPSFSPSLTADSAPVLASDLFLLGFNFNF